MSWNSPWGDNARLNNLEMDLDSEIQQNLHDISSGLKLSNKKQREPKYKPQKRSYHNQSQNFAKFHNSKPWGDNARLHNLEMHLDSEVQQIPPRH